jgi:putative ABC transport system substrate-binding protein
VSVPFAELVGKQLQLLKETVPGLSRVAVVTNPANPEHGPALGAAIVVGGGLGVELRAVEWRDRRDGPALFLRAAAGSAGALLVLDDPALLSDGELRLRAIQQRMPTISTRERFPEGGGLLSFGPSGVDLHHRVGSYVGRVLRGSRPADLPVERPARYELIVNLSTAQALGLPIPEAVRIRADRVIR